MRLDAVLVGLVCVPIGALGGIALGAIWDWWKRRRALREHVSPDNVLVNADLSGARRPPRRR